MPLYSTDLTDSQWEAIKPLLLSRPGVNTGGYTASIDYYKPPTGKLGLPGNILTCDCILKEHQVKLRPRAFFV